MTDGNLRCEPRGAMGEHTTCLYKAKGERGKRICRWQEGLVFGRLLDTLIFLSQPVWQVHRRVRVSVFCQIPQWSGRRSGKLRSFPFLPLLPTNRQKQIQRSRAASTWCVGRTYR